MYRMKLLIWKTKLDGSEVTAQTEEIGAGLEMNGHRWDEIDSVELVECGCVSD